MTFDSIWKAERKFGYYIIITKIIVFALLFLGILIYIAYDKYISWQHRNFIKIDAKIEKINNMSTQSFFTMTYYKSECVINYIANGTNYKKTTTFNLPFKPKVGDVGQILYDPTNPNNIIVPHQITQMLRKVIPIAILIGAIPAMIIISLMYLFRNNKYFQTYIGLQYIIALLYLLKKIAMPSYPF